MEKSIRSSRSKKEKGPSFASQGFPSRREKKIHVQIDDLSLFVLHFGGFV
jgi:hypothetical protein